MLKRDTISDKEEYLKDEFLNSVIIFQRKGYEGVYVWFEVLDAMREGSVEIFPGIFATIRCRGLIERIFRNWREKECITFDVRNIRDRFEVISNSKSQLQQMPLETLYVVEENVNPSEVEYPNALLGGKKCSCPISAYFHDLHICGEYKVISESEIVEKTRAIPVFAKMCFKSNCHKVLESIKNHGYKYDPNDMIQIDEIDGIYIPIEGKHRICVMKRYGYSHKVPMRVTHSSRSSANSYSKVLCRPRRQYVIDYYKRCEEYGLNEDDMRMYLNDNTFNLCALIAKRQGLELQNQK